MSELLEELNSELEKVKRLARAQNKKTGFCIGNTTQKINRDYFFTPIRNTSLCICGSIIIDRVAIAETITDQMDGEVDYIFVDTEKKISPELYGSQDVGNIERAVRDKARKSKVLTYKGNDLIVDAIDCFLAQLITSDIRGLGGKKVAIVGAGNIGFKLALKLTERGCHVVIVRRNVKVLDTIVRALNFIKPRGTLAKIEGTSDILQAVKEADIVIGLTPGTRDITADMIAQVKDGAVLVDGGKGSFSPEAVEVAHRRGLKTFRAAVTASFEGEMAMLLKMEDILAHEIGRREEAGISMVSGSLLGRKGDVVVDNIHHPSEIYGLADGCGDFIRELSPEHQAHIERLKNLIDPGTKEKSQ